VIEPRTATEIDLPLIRGKVPLTLNQRLHWREKHAAPRWS
jgi:hypothetical protein